MRPVNLLPERNRPRTPTGGQKGSAYILLAGLVLVLGAAVFYVLTLDSINSSKDKIQTANAQATRDNALASQLTPYGDFEKIKTQRVRSVMQLAQSRTDWERLVRELSLVLPDGVWLTSAAASQSGTPTPGGSGTPAPATGQSSTPGGPSLVLDGCARNQALVAVMLVRLHELQGASDVQLSRSSQPNNGGGGASTGDSGACGASDAAANYSFEATVSLTPQVTNTTAPPRLGGGS